MSHPLCPRCPETRLLRLDDRLACPKCHGLWLDRAQLHAVEPTLALIPLHADRALAGHTPYGGIARCPACGAPPATFPFFDVLIDWCAACGGVWLDGSELDALRRGIEEARATGGGPVSLRHFRQQAVEAVVIGTVRCFRCDARVPLPQTWMTEDGAACGPCGQAVRYGIEAPPPAELAALTADAEGRGAFTRMLRNVLGRG